MNHDVRRVLEQAFSMVETLSCNLPATKQPLVGGAEIAFLFTD